MVLMVWSFAISASTLPTRSVTSAGPAGVSAAFDGRLDAPRGGPHRHRLESPLGGDFHRDRTGHFPVGETRQLRLVHGPLIARPHLVQRKRGDAAGVHRYR